MIKTKQNINITATSLPRSIKSLHIYNAETITINEEAIYSLQFLNEIIIKNVKTLILKNRSLARRSNTKNISLFVEKIMDLQIYSSSNTFENWSEKSKIVIYDVTNCDLY